ncbi:MAG: CoA-acylating methylmalonate-semialdehyde dehydrogenase, partial [Caldilineaceae bacterium]|nr:CoA-acylating methylmalonate-semialdehyde dehydrogenase [Caldilineaceae bacterium]
MQTNGQLLNFINGAWKQSSAGDVADIINPATAKVLTHVPLSPGAEVDEAVRAGQTAFAEWKETPVGDRIQHMFKLKMLLEENVDDIAKTITQECGKTYGESAGELRRGIENVEVACGAPILMQGYNNEDIARGIDEHMFRQPLGVVTAITPFNFPGMIPLWFLPYAVVTGNCFILKPSEKVSMTTQKLFALIEQAGFPKGVIQLVNGSKETVNALLDHPGIKAVSFVGSTPVAKYVYQRATANGKRAQCQGGAKNPVIIMPDADMDTTTRILADSAFGCAGQRCLAVSVAVTVGDAKSIFTESIADAATSRKVGFGLDEGVEMGPVITKESQERIEGLIAKGAQEGATVLVDGRQKKVNGYEDGYFVFPTILEDVNPTGEIAKTEIFGPVLSLMHAGDVDEAIALVNNRAYGNQASIFTSSGSIARKFRHEVDAG